MALEIVVTTSRWKNDPTSRALVGYLQENQSVLGLNDAVIYYDFPAYVDYEASLFRPDVLILSPSHGFVAVRALDNSMFQRSKETLNEIDAALDDFSSNLHSRLIRSRELRRSRTSSVVEIHTIILLSPDIGVSTAESESIESTVCASLEFVSRFAGRQLNLLMSYRWIIA